MAEFLEDQVAGIFAGVAGTLIFLVFVVVVFAKPPLNSDNVWFQKYGKEVCRQRSADLHSLKIEGRTVYWVCQDRDTKVLSDFE